MRVARETMTAFERHLATVVVEPTPRARAVVPHEVTLAKRRLLCAAAQGLDAVEALVRTPRAARRHG